MTRLFQWAADWLMHRPTVARTWPDNDPWDPPVGRAHLSDFGVPRPSRKNASFLPHKWDGSKVLRMPREVTPTRTSDQRQQSCAYHEKWHSTVTKVFFLWLDLFVTLSFGVLYNNTLLQHFSLKRLYVPYSSPTSLRHWHDTRPVGTDLCHVFHWVRFHAVFLFIWWNIWCHFIWFMYILLTVFWVLSLNSCNLYIYHILLFFWKYFHYFVSFTCIYAFRFKTKLDISTTMLYYIILYCSIELDYITWPDIFLEIIFIFILFFKVNDLFKNYISFQCLYKFICSIFSLHSIVVDSALYHLCYLVSYQLCHVISTIPH